MQFSCTAALSDVSVVRVLSCVDVYGPRVIATICLELDRRSRLLTYIRLLLSRPIYRRREPRWISARVSLNGAVRLIRTSLSLDSIAALYSAPSWRHSARAAARTSLKLDLE